MRVPADFGEQRVVWTLTSNGETFAIPGHLHNDWLIDALHDPASGNVPPTIRFDPVGPAGQGPAGLTVGPRAVTVGAPLRLTVWGRDDLIRRPTDIPFGPPDRPAMTMTWVKHQGPGKVSFSEPSIAIDDALQRGRDGERVVDRPSLVEGPGARREMLREVQRVDGCGMGNARDEPQREDEQRSQSHRRIIPTPWRALDLGR